MRTDGALYLGILFYFELLILLNLRPDTLSRTQSYHDIELIEGIATFTALVKIYFIQYFYSQAKFLPRRNSGYTVPWSAISMCMNKLRESVKKASLNLHNLYAKTFLQCILYGMKKTYATIAWLS